MAQLLTDFLTHSPNDLGGLCLAALDANAMVPEGEFSAAPRIPGLDEEEEDAGVDEDLEDDEDLDDDDDLDDEDDDEEYEDEEEDDDEELDDEEEEEDEDDDEEDEEEDEDEELDASGYRLSSFAPEEDDDAGDISCGVAEDEFTEDDMDTDRVTSLSSAA